MKRPSQWDCVHASCELSSNDTPTMTTFLSVTTWSYIISAYSILPGTVFLVLFRIQFLPVDKFMGRVLLPRSSPPERLTVLPRLTGPIFETTCLNPAQVHCNSCACENHFSLLRVRPHRNDCLCFQEAGVSTAYICSRKSVPRQRHVSMYQSARHRTMIHGHRFAARHQKRMFGLTIIMQEAFAEL